ncbi:hypothetical protein R9D66_004261 [Citrobacter amalonaticus]|nr:hypothetical protein [Citrobacter amalonaticus]
MNKIVLVTACIASSIFNTSIADTNITNVHAHAVNNITLKLTGVNLQTTSGQQTLNFILPATAGIGSNVSYITGYRAYESNMPCPYVVYTVSWDYELKGTLDDVNRTPLYANAITYKDGYTSQYINMGGESERCKQAVAYWGSSDGGHYGLSPKNYKIMNGTDLPTGQYGYTLSGKALMAAGFSNSIVAGGFADIIRSRYSSYRPYITSGNILVSGVITVINFCNVDTSSVTIDHNIISANRVDGNEASQKINVICNGPASVKIYSPSTGSAGEINMSKNVLSYLTVKNGSGQEFPLRNSSTVSTTTTVQRGMNPIIIKSTLKGVPEQTGELSKNIIVYISYE